MTTVIRDVLNHRYRCWLFLPETLFQQVTGVKRDALFIWVPKCAGTSIYRTLVKYGCWKRRWRNPTAEFKNRGIVTFGHVDVLALVERGIVTRAFFERALKFAFVRNPFDRFVSLYSYLRTLRCDGIPEEMSFRDFCLRINRGEYAPIGVYNYKALSLCNPMVSWLSDGEGGLVLDFLGRYETLQDDFARLCEHLGIRSEVPHENKREHRPYRTYYDDETRTIVERVYREDLERFDYAF
jgi:hypothetical protein